MDRRDFLQAWIQALLLAKAWIQALFDDEERKQLVANVLGDESAEASSARGSAI